MLAARKAGTHTPPPSLLPPAGYPPVEAVKAGAPAVPADAASKAAALRESMREVVSSWRTWLLALTYFMVGF